MSFKRRKKTNLKKHLILALIIIIITLMTIYFKPIQYLTEVVLYP